MKKCFLGIMAATALLCFGCGSESNKQEKMPPIVLSADYVKEFVYEECPEAHKFKSEYASVQETIAEYFKEKKYEPVPINNTFINGLFTARRVEWSRGIGKGLYYLGPMSDNKPDGVGIIYAKYEDTDLPYDYVYAGNFEDGVYDGYGILYSSRYNYGYFSKLRECFDIKFYTEERYPVFGGYDFTERSSAYGDYIDHLKHLDGYREAKKNFISNNFDMYKQAWNTISYDGFFEEGEMHGEGNLYLYSGHSLVYDNGEAFNYKPEYINEEEKDLKQTRDEIDKLNKILVEGKEVWRFGGVERLKTLIKDKQLLLCASENSLKDINNFSHPLSTPKFRIRGKVFVFSGLFDEGEADGKFICYAQSNTKSKGYKLLEGEFDDDFLEDGAKIWNKEGELVSEKPEGEELTRFGAAVIVFKRLVEEMPDFVDYEVKL